MEVLKKYTIVFVLLLLIGCSSSNKTEMGLNDFSDDNMSDLESSDDELSSEDELASLEEDENEERDVSSFESQDETSEVLDENNQYSSIPLSGELTEYKVQKGDNLMKIAFETYGDMYQWKRIYDKNRAIINDFNNLQAGTMLKIEKPLNQVIIQRNGESYLINYGDTLLSISSDVYGMKTKWKRIWHNNPQLIKDPNRIYAGFYLYYLFTEQDRMEKGSK